MKMLALAALAALALTAMPALAFDPGQQAVKGDLTPNIVFHTQQSESGCCIDEPMDEDYLVLGHTLDFFEEDLGPPLEKLRVALQNRAAFRYLASASLEDYGQLYYAGGEIGNFVTTEDWTTISVVQVSGPAFAKN